MGTETAEPSSPTPARPQKSKKEISPCRFRFFFFFFSRSPLDDLARAATSPTRPGSGENAARRLAVEETHARSRQVEQPAEEVSGVVVGWPTAASRSAARLWRPGPAQRRRRRPGGLAVAIAAALLLAPAAPSGAPPRGGSRVSAAIDLGDALAQIATALRVPVLIAAIVVLLLCALELGRFLTIWRRRCAPVASTCAG